MSEQTNRCPNCGGNLEEKDGKSYCPHCGAKYTSNALTSLLHTAMEYENLVKKSTTNNRAKSHLVQAIHEYHAGNYADCKAHLNRTLDIDPNNDDANIIKSLLTKGQNGRYVSPPNYKIIRAIKNWLEDEDYKRTKYVNDLFLSELSSMFFISFFSISSLKKLFEQSSLSNKQEFLNVLHNKVVMKIIVKIVFWALFIILIISARSCNSSNSKSNSNTTTISVTYYASTGGTVYIPNENTRYTKGYTYNNIKSGTSTYAEAVPYSGYVFTKWSDEITYASRKDTCYSNKSVTAYFKPDTSSNNTSTSDTSSTNTSTSQNISLTYSASEGGYIVGNSSQKISSGGTCSEVTATPYFGYKFVSWNDGSTSATRKESNLTKNTTFTATFEKLFESGNGTEETPFTIATSSQLVNLMENCSYKNKYSYAHYILSNNIDLSAIEHWQGIYNFQGVFDGNNKTISNLKIDTSMASFNDLGLFRHTRSATIKNLNVIISIKNKATSTLTIYCGGICGFADNTKIINCSTSGSIDIIGSHYVYIGGIVGFLLDSEIESCSSTATLNGKTTDIYSEVCTGELYGIKS